MFSSSLTFFRDLKPENILLDDYGKSFHFLDGVTCCEQEFLDPFFVWPNQEGNVSNAPGSKH